MDESWNEAVGLRFDHLLTSVLATGLVLTWAHGVLRYLSQDSASAALGAFLIPVVGVLHGAGLI